MKGILKNTDEGWVVIYFDIEKAHDIMYCGESSPLYQETFDIDKKQPIVSLVDHKEVEFEFKYHWEEGMKKWLKASKIINVEYPELEGTMALCNDKGWDDIYHDYSAEQYPAFGGPFTDSISFIDWLKQNYKSPEKIKL